MDIWTAWIDYFYDARAVKSVKNLCWQAKHHLRYLRQTSMKSEKYELKYVRENTRTVYPYPRRTGVQKDRHEIMCGQRKSVSKGPFKSVSLKLRGYCNVKIWLKVVR